MRRGRSNGITMGRGPARVNRSIGGPPVGHNIGGHPRPAGDSGPLRRRVGPSDEHIDDATRGSPVRICQYPGRHPPPVHRPRLPDPRRAVSTVLPPSPRPGRDPAVAAAQGAPAASSPRPGRGPGAGPRPDPERRSSSPRSGAPILLRSPERRPDTAESTSSRRRGRLRRKPRTPLTSDESPVDFTDSPSGDAMRRDVTYYDAGCLADKVLAIELHSIPAGSTAHLRRPCAPRCDPGPDRTDTPRS